MREAARFAALCLVVGPLQICRGQPLLVTVDSEESRVIVYNADTGDVFSASDLSGSFSRPVGLERTHGRIYMSGDEGDVSLLDWTTGEVTPAFESHRAIGGLGEIFSELYVADFDNDQIARFLLDGRERSPLPISVQGYSTLEAGYYNRAPSFYLGSDDVNGGMVDVFDHATHHLVQSIPTGFGAGEISAIAVSPGGEPLMFVASGFGSDEVRAISTATGDVEWTFSAASPNIGGMVWVPSPGAVPALLLVGLWTSGRRRR